MIVGPTYITDIQMLTNKDKYSDDTVKLCTIIHNDVSGVVDPEVEVNSEGDQNRKRP